MPVAATLSAGNTGFLHQATRLITTDRMASATEFLSHSPAPIATTFLIVDVLDLPVQALALLIGFTLTPGIEATAADVHDTAQHRHWEGGLLRLDELVSQLDSLAKKAVAFFKTSFSIRNLRTSSRSFLFSASPSPACPQVPQSSRSRSCRHQRSTSRRPISTGLPAWRMH